MEAFPPLCLLVSLCNTQVMVAPVLQQALSKWLSLILIWMAFIYFHTLVQLRFVSTGQINLLKSV